MSTSSMMEQRRMAQFHSIAALKIWYFQMFWQRMFFCFVFVILSSQQLDQPDIYCHSHGRGRRCPGKKPNNPEPRPSPLFRRAWTSRSRREPELFEPFNVVLVSWGGFLLWEEVVSFSRLWLQHPSKARCLGIEADKVVLEVLADLFSRLQPRPPAERDWLRC